MVRYDEGALEENSSKLYVDGGCSVTIGHTDDTDLVTLSNGTVTVQVSAATTLTGDGSGITGVSANSIKSDDITEGDGGNDSTYRCN